MKDGEVYNFQEKRNILRYNVDCRLLYLYMCLNIASMPASNFYQQHFEISDAEKCKSNTLTMDRIECTSRWTKYKKARLLRFMENAY